MGERFAVITEELINLFVDKAVPENTKTSTSYAVNVFDGKLFVNILFSAFKCSPCCKIFAQFLSVLRHFNVS